MHVYMMLEPLCLFYECLDQLCRLYVMEPLCVLENRWEEEWRISDF